MVKYKLSVVYDPTQSRTSNNMETPQPEGFGRVAQDMPPSSPNHHKGRKISTYIKYARGYTKSTSANKSANQPKQIRTHDRELYALTPNSHLKMCFNIFKVFIVPKFFEISHFSPASKVLQNASKVPRFQVKKFPNVFNVLKSFRLFMIQLIHSSQSLKNQAKFNVSQCRNFQSFCSLEDFTLSSGSKHCQFIQLYYHSKLFG